ncbi:MAG: hypothetical protein ACPG49_03985 [Chitinophagales bacterium]
MKKSKLIITIFILLIINTPSFAQNSNFASLVKLNTTTSNTIVLNDPITVGFSKELEDIDGGPYYNEEWGKGRLLLKNGQELGKQWLFKYNTFQDELHVQLSSGLVKIPMKNQIQSFMILQNDKQHYFVSSDLSGVRDSELTNTFLEVLHSKRFTLLKKSSKHYEEVENDNFYCSTCDNSSLNFFLTSEKYYLKDKRSSFRKVKLNKTSILKSFPNHKAMIISYLKEHNIKLKTEAELLDLLQYIESPKNPKT